MTLWEVLEIEINKKQISTYQLTKKARLSINCLYHLKIGRTKDISFLNMVSTADILNTSLDIFKVKKCGKNE